MDLFNQNETIYIIDTNGLIFLDTYFKYDNPVFSAIWDEIEDLIQQGCFKTIDFVEQEIDDYKGKEEFLKKWIKQWKKQIIVETDVASINAAKPIINAEYNTGFLKQSKQAEGREEADPYLIGYCKVHNCTLITNESKLKANRIPAVAQKNGVICIDMFTFFEERGLRMERKK
jgi:hypothetical protein